jgi:hypothetical protein
VAVENRTVVLVMCSGLSGNSRHGSSSGGLRRGYAGRIAES